MSSCLRVEVTDGVAFLTLARPARRNALSLELLADIRAAMGRIVPGTGVRAVVLTGEGRCFSAGADLADLEGTPADAAFDDAVAETIATIRTAAVPVIAAVEGSCVGAALDMVLGCDVRVVAETAFFELPSVRLGILYNPAAVVRMRQNLSGATLVRLMLLGERFEGRDAQVTGIATHIAPEGEALTLAAKIARSLSAVPPQAVSVTAQFLRELVGPQPDLAGWQSRRTDLLASPERRVAVARAKAKLHGRNLGTER